MLCRKCGSPMSEDKTRCPLCGARRYTLRAESGHFSIQGAALGTVLEGSPDSPIGRRVISNPASGGQSESRTDAAGNFQVKLAKGLNIGLGNESHVCKILIQFLRAESHEVEDLSSEEDDRLGVDAKFKVDGHIVSVQIVSMPTDSEVWHQLSKYGAFSCNGEQRQAVSWVREALVKKSKRGASRRIVVLDACHFGAFVTPKLASAYMDEHRQDPRKEFNFLDVFIVGPTVRSTIRLGPK